MEEVINVIIDMDVGAVDWIDGFDALDRPNIKKVVLDDMLCWFDVPDELTDDENQSPVHRFAVMTLGSADASTLPVEEKKKVPREFQELFVRPKFLLESSRE
eukprot:TRINITY_DN24016_c0_g1_i1.p1 TRINITY_DN24016_c0_g1~~TRINITY_DN24016_c0_g1_i1.p1  ORF type:complete len:117 (+),score=43.27 TRINITY_DN24016_c0_g1_i1:47-352(+)